jgi:hypothetical protein
LAAILGGCGGGDNGGGTGTGTVTLRITDAPVDSSAVENVFVQFSAIELQGQGGRTTFYFCEDPANAANPAVVSASPCAKPKSMQIDLLHLTDGLSVNLLNGQTVPAGHYDWIRLAVDTAGDLDSYIKVSGVDHELTIPSGDETGLKLNRGFNVAAGGHSDFTVDFDLRKSVHVTGMGEYILRPTLRIVDNLLVGKITGTVAAGLATTDCSPAVYVFAGSGVTPDDIDDVPADPVTTATVKFDGSVYRYTAAYLEAGSYTVAFTCQALADDPATSNNEVKFSGAADVTVSVNATTVHNFEAPPPSP